MVPGVAVVLGGPVIVGGARKEKKSTKYIKYVETKKFGFSFSLIWHSRFGSAK